MKQRLLVVDDEPAILIAFRKLLQEPLVAVDGAESIEYAKALLDERSYDAVIADLRLSGIHGEEGISSCKKKKIYLTDRVLRQLKQVCMNIEDALFKQPPQLIVAEVGTLPLSVF